MLPRFAARNALVPQLPWRSAAEAPEGATVQAAPVSVVGDRFPPMVRPSATKKRRTGMVPGRGKNWTAKLRPGLEPTVGINPKTGASMLIPTPMLVAEELRSVRRGGLVRPAEIRERLARRFDAAECCPLVTGIFFSIIAGATEEAVALGRRPVAPWWRVVEDRKSTRLNSSH